MIRLGLSAGLIAALAIGIWQGLTWARNDAVRDFIREAAVAASERRAENQGTKARIVKEIDDASIDDLRTRAIAGGMFDADATD